MQHDCTFNYFCSDKSEEKCITLLYCFQMTPSTSYQEFVKEEHSLISSNKQSIVRDNEKTKEAFDASAEESSEELDEKNG